MADHPAVRTDVDSYVWVQDPTEVALDESVRRRDARADAELPTAFCSEVGRRLLIAELSYSDWTLRRVEKVQFKRDRSVTRRLSIEFNVPLDAPIFRDRQGKEHWLVPLSTMRRRTLVNLDLRDEGGGSITLLGIRLAQRLDQSLLLAAARAAATELGVELPLILMEPYIQAVVSGDRASARRPMARVPVGDARDSQLQALHAVLAQPVFRETLRFLRHNFSLFVMLDKDRGRHRMLRMSFDEPTNWRYQKPCLTTTEERDSRTVTYRAGGSRPRWNITHNELRASLGFKVTRVRFQIPSAENAASYHFEIEAPIGVRIVHATLLAGTPHEEGPSSLDEVVGHRPVVGLHAVEVPNNSLCRVQVDLRVPSRGWLTTLLASCWIVVAVLLWVLLHGGEGPAPKELNAGQVTNVILLLVTVTGGAATYVAQHAAEGVAARMVSGLRGLGAISIGLPAVEAGYLVFRNDNVSLWIDRLVFVYFPVFSGVIALALLWVWFKTTRDERRDSLTSPWDLTGAEEETAKKRKEEGPRFDEATANDFMAIVHALEFDSPAIGIESAEGWHEQFTSTAADRRRTLAVLRAGGHEPSTETGRSDTSWGRCQCSGTCLRASAWKPPPPPGEAFRWCVGACTVVSDFR